jgi:HD-GYP domain-containing protein (c-di-GMP phosphodiesterase class II)
MMPMEVLNKPGKLTDEEFRIIKSHPVEGHRLLVEGGTVGAVPLDVCLHHHEKVDGSGYPHRLKDEQISMFAKMGAVCDVYDAITSNRPYKAGWDPAESIRKMTEWCNGHFDGRIFPGLRQEHRHLSRGVAGAPHLRPPRRGHRTVRDGRC